MIPPWPLSSQDLDWFALDGSWTKHEAASEIVHNLMDWYLDDHTTIDDDDQVHGWVTAYRELLTRLKRGFIRPYEENDAEQEDSEWGQYAEPGWWFECQADHPKAVESWIYKHD